MRGLHCTDFVVHMTYALVHSKGQNRPKQAWNGFMSSRGQSESELKKSPASSCGAPPSLTSGSDQSQTFSLLCYPLSGYIFIAPSGDGSYANCIYVAHPQGSWAPWIVRHSWNDTYSIPCSSLLRIAGVECQSIIPALPLIEHLMILSERNERIRF